MSTPNPTEAQTRADFEDRDALRHLARDYKRDRDRYRAALERIAESKGNGLDQRIAREALDG